ncbi:MAG TPA: HIT family protein [Candidatus Enterocloster faecavium]|uniref:HIT family protein n=1 Tax=Candidatus Enterocloster faecavium TaxID=2838560 RepID=A0A9D2RM02_9FIRM|nr:HIT family protein [Candidatus Enterocloster faecavium]
MKDENCIFCKIANGEIPSTTLYEDEMFRVILDLGPASRGHALILPKEHFKDVCELDEKTAAKVLPLGAKIGAAMKKSLGCTGFNLVQNNGTSAGQTVFHFHMHIIPRYENGPAMVDWTPGKAEPEELAATAQLIQEGLQTRK